jgi:hypothetical protein
MLTLLRLLSDVFSTPVLSRWLFSTHKADMMRVVKEGMVVDEEDEEWEVEMVSAVVEAIEREGSSEDVGGCQLHSCLLFFGELTHGSFFLVHRLTATLALLLRLSPAYDTQLVPRWEAMSVNPNSLDTENSTTTNPGATVFSPRLIMINETCFFTF